MLLLRARVGGRGSTRKCPPVPRTSRLGDWFQGWILVAGTLPRAGGGTIGVDRRPGGRAGGRTIRIGWRAGVRVVRRRVLLQDVFDFSASGTDVLAYTLHRVASCQERYGGGECYETAVHRDLLCSVRSGPNCIGCGRSVAIHVPPFRVRLIEHCGSRGALRTATRRGRRALPRCCRASIPVRATAASAQRPRTTASALSSRETAVPARRLRRPSQ